MLFLVCLIPPPAVYLNLNLSTLHIYYGILAITQVLFKYMRLQVCDYILWKFSAHLVRRLSCWLNKVSTHIGGAHMPKNWADLQELKATFSHELPGIGILSSITTTELILPTTWLSLTVYLCAVELLMDLRSSLTDGLQNWDSEAENPAKLSPDFSPTKTVSYNKWVAFYAAQFVMILFAQPDY